MLKYDRLDISPAASASSAVSGVPPFAAMNAGLKLDA